jgi:hypothetical protein
MWQALIAGTAAGCKPRAAAKCVAVGRDEFKAIASKDLKKAFPEQVVLFKSDDFSMPLLAGPART